MATKTVQTIARSCGKVTLLNLYVEKPKIAAKEKHTACLFVNGPKNLGLTDLTSNETGILNCAIFCLLNLPFN